MGEGEDMASRSQPCGEASADAEVFAGRNAEPSAAGGAAIRDKPRVLTSVDADLHAFHTDPYMNEGRHDHVWNVRLVFEGEPFRDARAFRSALIQWLEPWQGKDLPAEWWAAEDLAAAVLTLGTGDPIGCVITRPGFQAEIWL